MKLTSINATAGNTRKNKGKIDYYPTPPYVTEALMDYLIEDSALFFKKQTCWEPAAGGGHMSYVLKKYFKSVRESDIIDHEDRGFEILDFLEYDGGKVDWIITNPPFTKAADFALKALEKSNQGVALFCRTTFLESQTRWNKLFSKHKPSLVMPFVKRVNLVEGKISNSGGSAVSYSWFVWEHGKTETNIQWIP